MNPLIVPFLTSPCRPWRTTAYYFGDSISTDQANYGNNFSIGFGTTGANRKRTMPVGSFPPNAFGLYDMHGNVWQWCQDFYGEYPQNEVVDPHGPTKGKIHVLRGGSGTILLNTAVRPAATEPLRNGRRNIYVDNYQDQTPAERTMTTENKPLTTQRELHFEHGPAVGTSQRWQKGQYCSILTPAGIVGCGIYDLKVAAEFDMAIAIARGTPACPLVEPEDLFEARIVGVTPRAAASASRSA